MKKMIVIFMLMFLLTGCAEEINAEAYKDEAARLLSTNIDESFIYSSAEIVDEKSEYFRYYFTSEARDLVISVDSYMTAGMRQYETDYYLALSNLYINDVISILESGSFELDKTTLTLTINDPKDFDELAKLLYECEYLIGTENAYHNNGYFTLEHPFITINVIMDGYSKFNYQFDLCGYFTEDDIYQYIYTYYMGIE